MSRLNRPLSLFTCLLNFVLSVEAQDLVIPLWEDKIPCANEWTMEVEDQGSEVGRFFKKVHTPEIAVYHPEHPNGTAVLICPGGGYAILAYDWEGVAFAKWFTDRGITAVVLKYRLPHWETPDCRDKVALPDAQRAMQLIREHADEWSVDAGKIGVMGFSAGGHLAATLSTHYQKLHQSQEVRISDISPRPDFSILVYPVISMKEDITHQGSRKNLIGEDPSPEQVTYFSNEIHITKDTPPTLLVHASNDHGVKVANSIRYYENLVAFEVPASLLVYETGGHGFAMAKHEKGAVSQWLEQLEAWLKERELR